MWFSAKCIFLHKKRAKDPQKQMYEERIVILKAKDSNWAIKKAENEAAKYAQHEECDYLMYVDCFKIQDKEISDDSEVYSIMKMSDLEPEDFITQYYDSGDECSQEHEEYDYGLDADITAIGPYSESIANFLEYPKELYKNTKDGKTVIVNSVLYANGKRESKLLADCFNIDIWDFNQHEIDPDKANIFKLNKEFGDKDTKAFLALRDAGFKFYFMPYDDFKLSGQ